MSYIKQYSVIRDTTENKKGAKITDMSHKTCVANYLNYLIQHKYGSSYKFDFYDID